MANPIPDSDLEQVLTLHRGIAERWAGSGSLNGAAAERDNEFRGVDRMLSALPGLASMSGSFGADAWDLANFLTVEGRFARTLSTEVRAMSIGDIADIVQLILEEEELSQLEESLQRTRAQVAVGDKAVSRSAKPARKPAARRATPAGMRRKIQAVRRSLAQVRARVALQTAAAQQGDGESADAALTADSFASMQPAAQSSGDSVSAPLAQVGTEGPVVLGLAETLRAFARTASARADSSPISAASRAVLGSGGVWSPQASGIGVGFQSTATRALQMAETTAELAMLQPDLEIPWLAAEATSAAALESSAAQGAPVGPAEVAQQPIAPDARAVKVQAARQMVRRAAQAGTAAHTPEARIAGRSAAMRLPQPNPTVGDARGGGQIVGAPGATIAPQQARSSHATAPALTGAIQLAERHLARHARAIAAVGQPRQRPTAPLGDSVGERTQTRPALAAHGVAPIVAGPSASAPPTFAVDRFAHLLDPAAESLGQRLLPRLADWYSAGDQLLRGQTPATQGYLATELGAGEALRLGEVDGPQVADPATVSAPPTRRVAATSVPTWIAPLAAQAAQAMSQASIAASGRSAPAAPRPTSARAGRAAPTSAPPARFDASTAETAAPPAALAYLAAPRHPDPVTRGQDSYPPASHWTTQLPGAAAPTGGVGIAAVGLAQRLATRHLAGIDPTVTSPAWQPLAALSGGIRPTIGMAPVGMAETLAQAAIGFSRGETPAFALPGSELTRLAKSTVAGLGGALGREVGAGEWLLPGDEGYDQWFAEASDRPEAAPPLKPPRSATRRSAPAAAQANLSATGADQPPTLAGLRRAEATAHPLPAVAPVSAAPTLARAASAAIAHVVDRHERANRLVTHQPTPDSPTSPLAIAGLGGTTIAGDVLGLAPGGATDAITPWLLRGALARLPAETRRALRIAGVGSGVHVELGQESSDAGVAPVASSAAALKETTAPAGSVEAAFDGATSATAVRGAIARRADRQRVAIERAISRPDVRQQLRRLGSGALDIRQPVALKAAMALFGESGAGPIEAEVTRSFLERWFGGAEAGVRSRPLPTIGSGDLVALQAETSSSGLRTASDRAMTAMATESDGAAADVAAEVGGQEFVVSGLAGLQALRTMRGAGQLDAELLATGEVQQTSATTTSSDAATAAAGTAATTAVAASDKRSGAVRLHDFAPVALGRGRSLLGRGRRVRQPGLVRGSRSARFGGRRVGYGQAGLGGGPLVGLVAGDGGEHFHGDTFGSTGMTMRAEGLSASVEARQQAASGPVGRTLRGPRRPQQGRAGLQSVARSSEPGLPRDFSYGESTSELVSPQAAMERAARGATARLGGTAQDRSMKAGAMARVLSVTASPTAEVLPLVAPAARAIASMAAAKSLDESVITSGSDPSAGTPIDRQAGGGSQDQGEATTDEQGSELGKEINALAQRIARSVMVRIKRERERRGIHG